MAEESNKQPEQFSADFLIKTVDEGMKQGRRFCFIIGAGASMSSGIKSGQELGYQWLKWLEDDGRLEMLEQPANILYNNEQMQHPYKEIIKAFNEGKERRKLPSEFYFDAYKLRFYPDNSLGFAELERMMSDAYPSFAYFCMARFLAKYNNNCNLVITTNFDNLVEDSLFIYTDQKPLVVNHESLAEYAVNPYIKRPIVAKVHRGLFFDPLNDKAETDQLKGKWKSVLSYLFTSYTPIIIGYGGGDHSLMALLQDESVQFRGRFYWCSYKDEALNDPTIRELVLNKNGVFVETDGFDNVMLKFGNALFMEEIIPNAVKKYLDRQNDAWFGKYNEGYTEAVKAENKDTETLKTEQQSDFERRESEGKLNAWDYFGRGYTKAESDDFLGAIADYDKAIELDPNYSAAYNNRGNAYADLKQYDRSIADYNKAIELDPNYAYAYNNRGTAYADLKQYDRAIADYDKAIELDPNYAAAYNNRGLAYADLKQYDRAIADYNKAIELDPNDADTYYNRGSAYADLKQYDKAIADFDKAIELGPNDAAAYNNRGNAYDDLKQHDKAIADYDKAIELDPNYIKAYYNRADAYDAIGEAELAAADRAKAQELASNQ